MFLILFPSHLPYPLPLISSWIVTHKAGLEAIDSSIGFLLNRLRYIEILRESQFPVGSDERSAASNTDTTPNTTPNTTPQSTPHPTPHSTPHPVDPLCSSPPPADIQQHYRGLLLQQARLMASYANSAADNKGCSFVD